MQLNLNHKRSKNFYSITGTNDGNKFEFRFFKRPNGEKYVQIWKHFAWPYDFSDKMLISERSFLWFLKKIRTCPDSAIERCDEIKLYYHRDFFDVHLIKMDDLLEYETSSHLIIDIKFIEKLAEFKEYLARNIFKKLDKMLEYSDEFRREVNFSKPLYDPILELEIDKKYNQNGVNTFVRNVNKNLLNA